MIYYLDAMGGDNAPLAIIEGAILAVNEYNIDITLVGDTNSLTTQLKKYTYNKDKIRILHASTNIGFDEEPTRAIRSKKDSSIVVALNEIKKDPNSVFVSAGSTGALLAGGLLILGRIKGIKRPALPVFIPKNNGTTLLIDSGANADCKASYLEQFAQLGSIYLKCISSNAAPKIRLVNIGGEEEKGNMLYKEAYQLLKSSDLNFLGNVEAKDIPTTDADIIVCDGFTGNVILKLLEGVASFLLNGIKNALMSSLKGKIGAALIKGNLKKLKNQLNADEYGGAPLLGVNGGVIKAHGSSNALAIKNALHQAILFYEQQVLEKTRTHFLMTDDK